MAQPEFLSLVLPTPTPADLSDLQAQLSQAAGHDLSARDMGELLGYRGRGVADRRWRDFMAGTSTVDPFRWTLLMLMLKRHPHHRLATR